MAFGDTKTDETVVDHDAEAAEQAAIAAEVEEAPPEQPQPDPTVDQADPTVEAEQPPTVEETAETDPLAAPPEETVTVEATNSDLSSAAVGGYEVDFTDGAQVDGVPAFVAEELALGDNVEVVEEEVA